MGYDVHVTRRNQWSDEHGDEITRAEWLAYVGADSSMRLEKKAIVRNAEGAEFSVEDETLAVWKDWPNRQEGRNEAWMWLGHGNVMAKNPDEFMLRKMFLIADALGAKVQGDEGETYNSLGQMETPQRRAGGRPWWKFW